MGPLLQQQQTAHPWRVQAECTYAGHVAGA
jgi:hypothetical protein